MKRKTFLACLLPLVALAASTRSGIDSARLSQISARMKTFVDRGEIPGAVTLVLHNGTIVHHEAVGWQDIERKRPMRSDTIFQIMSMTKPITGVAIMMLAEEGRLTLSDPVEKHLPEFRGLAMKDGSRPKRHITIRDLMSHTSGMASMPPEHMKDFYSTLDRPLADTVKEFARQPLDFDPGTKWQYSNPGLATLGRIVEVAADQPYELFLEQRLFRPLGMKDTFVFPPADKLDRIAMVYVYRDGKLQRGGRETLGGDPWEYRKGAKYTGPEFSLFSNAPDLAHFYQMMANGGTYQGRRYLSRASVDMMTKVHTGDLQAGHNPGTAFGLTWEVVKDQTGSLTLLSPGTFKHGGAFGTHGWIDPEKKIVGVFLIQRTNDDKRPRDVFMQMVGSAVTD
jgi:CubicO group peptidase (beta-lactamase class C family)